jgi:2-polyprenyl-3-methyl-5-hydroxy-6-metoxy-1,4-benzoquinol methylase
VTPRARTAEMEAKLQAWAEQDVVDEQRLAVMFGDGNLEHYRRLLALVEAQHPNPRRRLLDIGCATGALLTVARERRWTVSGLEIGLASSQYARERLGLSVERRSVYDFEPEPGAYDAVAFLEVIEHLEHPLEALRRIHTMLVPGGLLLVTTPNYDSLYRRLFGARWWVVNCEDEHIVLFTRDTLTGALRDAGFEPVAERIRGLDVPGLLREAKRALHGGAKVAPTQDTTAEGYYVARNARSRIKSALGRLRMLAAAKALLRGLERTFSWRFSPTHAWGEQLVMVARRKDRPPTGSA